MWDDVVRTCGNQRSFCSEDCVATWLDRSGHQRGYVMDVPTLWRLASGWYTGSLERGYLRREPREPQGPGAEGIDLVRTLCAADGRECLVNKESRPREPLEDAERAVAVRVRCPPVVDPGADHPQPVYRLAPVRLAAPALHVRALLTHVTKRRRRWFRCQAV